MNRSYLFTTALAAIALAGTPALAAVNGAGSGGGAGYNNGYGGANGNRGAGAGASVGGNARGGGGRAGQGALLTISPSGVRQVQQALNRLGYSAGAVNGIWDAATATAMVHFQQAHGLMPTGNLNISSIAGLGLWNDLIGNPIGNRNAVAANVNSGVPPMRGGKKPAQVGGEPLPSQRITIQHGTTDDAGVGAGVNAGVGAGGGAR